MQLRSCAYVALYELCKQNTLFDEGVFSSFVNETYKHRHLEQYRYDAYKLFTEHQVPMPVSIPFSNKAELLQNIKYV